METKMSFCSALPLQKVQNQAETKTLENNSISECGLDQTKFKMTSLIEKVFFRNVIKTLYSFKKKIEMIQLVSPKHGKNPTEFF